MDVEQHPFVDDPNQVPPTIKCRRALRMSTGVNTAVPASTHRLQQVCQVPETAGHALQPLLVDRAACGGRRCPSPVAGYAGIQSSLVRGWKCCASTCVNGYPSSTGLRMRSSAAGCSLGTLTSCNAFQVRVSARYTHSRTLTTTPCTAKLQAQLADCLVAAACTANHPKVRTC